MPGASSSAGSVRRNDEANRYELTVDGRFVGLAAYLDRDGQRVFYHTEIEKSFQGRGLGSALVGAALADTREDGKRVVGACSLVAHYLDKQPEFSDIADPVGPDIMRWLDNALG
ncbi:GNAT family N-acetyltransferase [Amycolatopsis taiwanensis]|uniref:N-acetyltransferase n=1 Tax=Amycolatopsis taiwanensis TaxID=342230 RepID=A0A9W6VHI5_9PSEU|nr:GNAT family N-acetyltransferase [Amycolatopsis taiwanensis]GLY66501.1 N-acetyltransferase [Amycolatopsis taiwanensis]